MKKLITILLIGVLTMVSCSHPKYENTFTYIDTVTVLNKRTLPHTRGGGLYYYIYIYNGTEAVWYETTYDTYAKYKVNDTLPALNIFKTLVIKQ